MGLDHAKEYLARVLPWPQANEEPCYVNIHWTFVPKDGQVKKDSKGKEILPWGGKAVQSVHAAANAIEFALKQSGTRDVYVCLSTQRTAVEKVSAKGFKYHTPVRNQQNAVALKSFFIDIDFKGGEHGYDSQGEASAAMVKFIADVGLPQPSVVVHSGGGLHIYWTLMQPLRPAEWTPLAHALAEATKKHGLKCDTQVTIDCARVLRVPDTLNHKTVPPRPVAMLAPGKGGDYTLERLSKVLEPYRTLDAPVLPALRPLTGISDLAAGVDMGHSAPIDLNTVLPECPFLMDAVTSGGKTLSNPLWNLTTLISTFTQGGRADAHRMASGHPGYSKESTDDLFDRKTKEKDLKGLGWPACKTISGSGSVACQGCKHFAAGKSPLHWAQRSAPVPAAGNLALASQVIPGAPAIVSDVPDGWVRLPTGLIALLTTQVDGTTVPVPICDYRMEDPWLQEDAAKGLILHFTTAVEKKRTKKISIPARVLSGQEMRPTLQEQGLMLYVGAKGSENVARFFVAWIKKLQETRSAIITAPFGWSVEKASAQVEGFVFDNTLWTPTGPQASGSPDRVLASQYTPSGSPAKWIDACKLITAQGRPDLDTIVASSFAAPLVRFTGEEGCVMCAYSIDSGIGKTTAQKIAQAVWGHPIMARQGLTDTYNSVMEKLGKLRALPLYWDEIRTEDQVRKFVNIVFETASGKGRSRLTRNIEQREPGSWQTLLVACANDSVMDMVNNHCNTTAAGMLRVVEFVVAPSGPNTPGQLDPSKARLLVAGLNDNYGHIGRQYAEWLGMNFVMVEKDVADTMKAFGDEVNEQKDERYWTSCISSILVGAKYSNQLGFTQFDLVKLKEFMVTLLGNLRNYRRNTAVDMTKELNLSDLFTQFLSAHRARHTLRTNRIHTAVGKPPVGYIKVIGDTSRLESVIVHVGMEDKKIRFTNFGLKEWLGEKGYNRTTVVTALIKEFQMKKVTGRIAGGTHLVSGGNEHLWEIDLAGYPILNFIDEA